jgi:predicted nuclease with TOPRIM domain
MQQGEQKDSVSDTPRTDARLIEGIMLDGRVEQLDRVYATFARKLERELNEANAIIRQQQLLDEENLRLQERIKRLEEAGDALYECLFSVAGENHPAKKSWRKAKEAKP